MDNIIYIAKFEYGKPRLLQTTFTRETEKSYIRTKDDDKNNVELIECSYIFPSKRVAKDVNVFTSLNDAAGYLISLTKTYIARMESAINEADQWIDYLESGELEHDDN